MPKGFTFKVQVCTCATDHMDLLPLLASYFEQVGVKIEIQPMEYGAYLSAMTTKTNAPGYMMNNGHTNPTTSIRKSFVTGQALESIAVDGSRIRQENGWPYILSAMKANVRLC